MFYTHIKKLIVRLINQIKCKCKCFSNNNITVVEDNHSSVHNERFFHCNPINSLIPKRRYSEP